MAIVYRHRRLDNNKIFYIGISKNNKRAFDKNHRNKYWNNIVNKTNYSVEIIADNLSWEEACELECFLISEYGRKDLNTGILCNMTDGGEGTNNKIISEKHKEIIRINNIGNKNFLGKTHSIENRIKFREIKLGTKLSNETKMKISKANKGKCYNNKKVINTETLEIFESVKILSSLINIKYSTLVSYLNNSKVNKTIYKYL